MLSFGVTVLPDPPYQRLIELMKLAEAQGFEYAWTYDSHVLWQESMPVMALAADQTSKIKLGHMVTNPATRDPTVLASAYATLHDISNGRMIMGVGRGDSAVRYVGRKPMKVAEFEEALQMIKPFMNGQEVTWNEKELQLKWVRPELPEIEMHVAGYGPKALAVAGRQGDGVIIQLADPDIIQWIMETARKAAEEAGRDPSALKCIVSAPSHISDDLADARNQVRWFPAMVSNHVQDLIDRYGTDGSTIPKVLTDYVEARKFYDYNEHSRVGAKHGEFVTDEICDRFCAIGKHRAGDREAARARVDRRRPVQRLPDDRGSGGDARGIRQRHPARFCQGDGIAESTESLARWDASAAAWEAEAEGLASVNEPVSRALLRGARPRAGRRDPGARRRYRRARSGARAKGRAGDLHGLLAGDGRRGQAPWDPGCRASRPGHAGDRSAGRQRRRRPLPLRLHARAGPGACDARDAARPSARREGCSRHLGRREEQSLGDPLRPGADRARPAWSRRRRARPASSRSASRSR